MARPRVEESIAHDLAGALATRRQQLHPEQSIQDKLRAYRHDPVGFAREVLGVRLWSKQREIANAILTHDRVAIVSGQKTGKSETLACLAIWWFCMFDGARVYITGASYRTVKSVIWRAIRMLVRRAKLPIPGADNIHDLPESGLVDPLTFAEIRGGAAKSPENLAGFSGSHILYLVDEASGVLDELYEAIQGNCAGGGKIFAISNPTRAKGWFFDAFHKASEAEIGRAGWRNFHVDSREGPNCTGEWREISDAPIAGLATPEQIERWRVEHGEQSAYFQIRVAGNFAVAEEARLFGLSLIWEAQTRWESTEPTGRLIIGIDPAGETRGGDDSAFVARRGKRVLEIELKNGITPAEHVREVLRLIDKYNPTGHPEPPMVNIESEGQAGNDVYQALYRASKDEGFQIHRIRTGDAALRRRSIYPTRRDELAANLHAWFRDGGAIPEHAKLEQDLHALEFKQDSQKGLEVLISKKELRKILGRSPDAGDALMFACWESTQHAEFAPRAEPVRTSGLPYAEKKYGSPYKPNPYRSNGAQRVGSLYRPR